MSPFCIQGLPWVLAKLLVSTVVDKVEGGQSGSGSQDPQFQENGSSQPKSGMMGREGPGVQQKPMLPYQRTSGKHLGL